MALPTSPSKRSARSYTSLRPLEGIGPSVNTGRTRRRSHCPSCLRTRLRPTSSTHVGTEKAKTAGTRKPQVEKRRSPFGSRRRPTRKRPTSPSRSALLETQSTLIPRLGGCTSRFRLSTRRPKARRSGRRARSGHSKR
jgi:hypothetical protein